MTINLQKKNLRILCSKKRQELNKNDTNSSFKLTKKIIEINGLENINFVASFIPIKNEISTAPLNNYFLSIGKKICLPVIINNNNHLIFRLYNKTTNLKRGKFGILEPDEKNKHVIPDLILTPCLAFDQFGYRLGYGGGYYDHTFAKLRKSNHPFIAIAVAYEGQKIDRVIRDKNDQKIDFILTEKKNI